jgi:ankyrin repeat protein
VRRSVSFARSAAAPGGGEAESRAEEFIEALAQKQISKVCRIVERLGVDVDVVLNGDRETAVHACVEHCGAQRDPGFVPVLRCLLRLGANPDAPRVGGQTPAHRCAAFDLTPMLALLDEFGADVDVEDDDGFCPAHVCAALGKTSALDWLLTRGAVHCERLHRNGMTLAMFAAKAGHLETLRCLRRRGADLCWNQSPVDGRPGISSPPSTSPKSNSFSMILEPLILAF